ncbi:MAG: ATP-binding protein [Opitutales bacterium]|nr:ATP-binding protein [Opitutales bacterium]
MKLEAIIIQNFRGFHGKTVIPVSSITTFVGRNDAGKSSILDALGVFFEHPLCKPDHSDACVYPDGSGEMRVGCVFSELPESITLDSSVPTTLRGEYLLNAEGKLEAHKVWQLNDGKISKLKTLIIANHPTAEGYADLLQQKRPALQKLVRELGVEAQANMNANPSLRAAIWQACPDLQIQQIEIQTDKEDAKTIGEQIARFFPAYALFRADRPSTDEDAEVQDPFKVAIQQAISELESALETIKTAVRTRAMEVAERTLTKLKDFDPALAETLEPNFSKAMKWDSLFKLSLDSDDGISINKRGSGTRRLVLFSFFRAEAERIREQNEIANIIYAIEEPETAQHPSNQRKVIEALISIAETDGCQVILTTHVPGLAGLAPVEGIRHVRRTGAQSREVLMASDENLHEVARELGVLPDKRAQAIVCVEGPTDIQFLRRISRLLNSEDPTVPDLENDPRIAIVLLGGSTLKQWVNEHLLKNLNLPEVHIYDSDVPGYADSAAQVNRRTDGSKAFITQKREIENYLHADAIEEAFRDHTQQPILINLTDQMDVETEIKNLLGGQKKVNRRSLKSWLNEDAADKMTIERLVQRNAKTEILSWLQAIRERLS